MITNDDFLAEIEAFLARSGMAPTRFGADAVGDPNFVRNLRSGRSPSLKTVDRVLECIRQNESGLHSTNTNSEVAA